MINNNSSMAVIEECYVCSIWDVAVDLSSKTSIQRMHNLAKPSSIRAYTWTSCDVNY